MNNIITTREEIPNLVKPNSIGCELGVFEGEFANILIQSNKFDHFYLVDRFAGRASNFGKKYRDASVLELKVKERFKHLTNVSVIKNDSLSFLQSLDDNSLDFIYIDTRHSYKQTIRELNQSHRVIRNNGLICGHDYCEAFSGVIQSVQEFISKYNFPLIITTEADSPSFIIKVTK